VSAETIQRNEREVLPGLADPTESRAAAWVPGDPGPLGLGMFGITTFVLSVINAHLVGSAVTPTVFGLALAGGGLAQLVAGIWEFRTGNTFGAVVFCSFAAFWISFYFLLHNSVPTIPKAEVDASLGLFLWAWTIYTGILFLLSIGFSGGHESTIKLGGYFGIATAAAAWYTCGAALVNATWGRVVVPTFPLGT
jgi:succinate-acetate transporter protein